MSTLTLADLLDKAADHIKRYGWHRGSFTLLVDDDERPMNKREVCVVGAIRIAAGLSPYVMPDPGSPAKRAGNELVRHLRVANLPNWNDRQAESAEQVIAELRACAADLRKGATA